MRVVRRSGNWNCACGDGSRLRLPGVRPGTANARRPVDLPGLRLHGAECLRGTLHLGRAQPLQFLRSLVVMIRLPSPEKAVGFLTCPGCSAWPEVLRTVARRKPDRVWMAYCVQCEIRPSTGSTREDVRKAWNERHARALGLAQSLRLLRSFVVMIKLPSSDKAIGFLTCLGCSAWPEVHRMIARRKEDRIWIAYCVQCETRPSTGATREDVRQGWNERNARA